MLDTNFKRRPHSVFLEILKSAMPPGGEPKILDVGCGFGVIGALRGSPVNVFGIENDARHKASASKNCQKLYALDLEGFRKSQIAERDFDLIFCCDVLEHLHDPDKILGELIGLLGPGGRVVISLPNIAQLPFRLKLLFGRFDYTEAGVMAQGHLRFFTFKTACEMIQRASLVRERFYPAGTVVSFINLFPRLLAAQLVFVCRKNNELS